MVKAPILRKPNTVSEDDICEGEIKMAVTDPQNSVKHTITVKSPQEFNQLMTILMPDHDVKQSSAFKADIERAKRALVKPVDIIDRAK